MKNWKTTLSGVFTVLPMVLHAIIPNVITLEVAAALSALFASLGLAASKDFDKTGTANKQ